ncbi:MAG: hypothetical protein V5B60_03790 [Accumulibacter sp.]|jgi:uncharacterized Tic20 family protein|uniref:hypothetical protein n=1 Tax=Accumulibacter sp. TaxID=2053492 RepID=UPI002FC2BD76
MLRLSIPRQFFSPQACGSSGDTGPVIAALLGSVLLSLLAFSQATLVGRDAALYLDVARQVLEQGAAVAFQAFDWPWFSLLLAATGKVFGLPLETAAHLWCTLFVAGTSALLVVVTLRFSPGCNYWASLVVLSLPAFNQFRGDIIREHGSWFFSVLALHLALQWLARGGWSRAAAIQAAIGVAALFRLEALVLMPALAATLLGELHTRAGWMRLLQLNALPLAVGLAAALALASGTDIWQPRIAGFAAVIDPRALLLSLDEMANQFAKIILEYHSKEDARQILVFGLLLTLLVKFCALNGPLCVPLLYRANWRAVSAYWRELRPFAWTWLLYLGVLLIFFIKFRFINSRYTSFLNLLVVPLLTMALMLFCRSHARWSPVAVFVLLVFTLANTVSRGPGKTHYLEAAAWLAENTKAEDRVYYEDARIAYYAGRGYPRTDMTVQQVMAGADTGRFRYYVLTHRPNEDTLLPWLAKERKQVVRQFRNPKGETILVIGE